MRVLATKILSTEEKRDAFLAFLRRSRVNSQPKRIDDQNMPWIEFQLPNKWKLHEVKRFLEELEEAIRA